MERCKHIWWHFVVSFIALAIMGIVAMITLVVQPLDPIKRAIEDFSFTDIYYEIINDTKVPEENQQVTIVDMTQQVSRSAIAQTLMDIESLGAKAVGVDCTFDVVGDNYAANDSIIRVAETYPNIIFALKANDSSEPSHCTHSFFADFVDIREGTVNVPRGRYDNMIRRIPTGEMVDGRPLPSMLTQLVWLARGDSAELKDVRDVMVNFSPMKFSKLAPEEVLAHPELIHNRIVLYGCLNDYADTFWCPAGRISGVELWAYALDTVLNEKEVKELSLVPFCLLTFFIVLLAEIFQVHYLHRTSDSSHPFVRHILGSSYIVGLLTFLIVAVFIWLGFLIFKYYNLSFNLAWATSVIAFLGTARNIYKALENYLSDVLKGRKKPMAVCLLLLLIVVPVRADNYKVLYVAGNVTMLVNGRDKPLRINEVTTDQSVVTIPEQGRLELLDEAKRSKLILKSAGSNKIANLRTVRGNSVMQLSADYMNYLARQLTNKGLTSKQRLCDFATVTREKHEDADADANLSLRDRFEMSVSRQRASFRSFRDSIMHVYIDFVRNGWKEVNVMERVQRPADEPWAPPSLPSSETVPDHFVRCEHTDIVNISHSSAAHAHPAFDVREASLDMDSKIDAELYGNVMPFDFYGTSMQVRLDEGMKFNIGVGVPDNLAEALAFFACPVYDNLLFDCLQLKEKYHLGDWAYIMVVKTLCDQFLGSESNESSLLIGYLLGQSGYNIRFARNTSRLYVMIASDYTILDKTCYYFNDIKYYPLTEVSEQLLFCEAAMPNEQMMSLCMTEPIQLAPAAGDAKRYTSTRYPDVAFDVAINANLLRFMADYPSAYFQDVVYSRWLIPANAPLSLEFRKTGLGQLREALSNLDNRQKVDRLLNLLQTSFAYKADEEVWGHDRVFFAEETMNYPYSDCEDRAILFVQLVRELTGLDCALVYYPGHLAAAVCLGTAEQGFGYEVGGRHFLACDPCYVGAKAGVLARQYQVQQPTVIPLASIAHAGIDN